MNIIKTKISYFILFIVVGILSSCQTTSDIPEPHAPVVTDIAIMMPLSGADAVVGRQYNALIKMGIEDGLKGSHINVTSYDAADEKQALASLEKIIARKTKIILGPLYSPITSLIADKVKEHDIIVITMSNNPALADSKLFVFGHAPLKQLTRIVSYFLNAEAKHFIALLPAGQHAQTISKIIQEMAITQNSTLVRTEFYADNPESINKAVKIVEASVDNLNEMDDITSKPIIYLADDYKSLNLVFNSIHKYNLDKKAIIIGDNRIDIDSPVNIDITFTGSLNILNMNVSERAKDMGINHMSFMHAMAYDLGRMAISCIGDDFISYRFLSKLNSKQPYIGISGNLYFIDNIAQREYDIIKRENGTYSTLATSK
ncbi:Penicillin-binding protein activator [Candidatus Trichorickettsia mobilis]|uniref:Penicillin-binding protein activator n=1 Tax=Candidatus Trichorickettsia mobilis TaxID=1346319 RepID=A0ABZ0UQU3_9RICK|nr:penicillin-binding protein activator [Candidatus Trichorickettsia mobilis]WPY00405.1 Penicillin-binding protein activator [Candidatus Trichorickettsia mobilis]